MKNSKGLFFSEQIINIRCWLLHVGSVRRVTTIKKLNADYEAGLITADEVRSCKASYEGMKVI